MPDGSKVRVALNMDELVASYVFETTRGAIDSEGAKGIFNGFGQAVVEINGHPVLALRLHEDRSRRVVLELVNLNEHGEYGIPTVIEVERDGKVPARTGRTT